MIYKKKRKKKILKCFFFFNKENSTALQKANAMVELCWEISGVIYKKNLKMTFFFLNKKNEEENYTAPLNASVKVEISWGNKQCDL